ncbi:Hypothetical protein, putative [Bodo saltans]|uniref:Membrane-associated protein n=1 Tax=Bodo saltans TaxID=75058 RepID=A0A0S4ILB6_BODSA|nr:Hypothetical protein, putative [Bodo saltans]|eukprot:CUE70906.1 Hypothetical protein, putative [Bodo saltans]
MGTYVFRVVILILFVAVRSSDARIVPPLLVTKLASGAYSMGIEVADDGTVFVSSRDWCTVNRMLPSGILSVIAGSAGSCGLVDGVGTAARFHYAEGMSRAGNILYIADEMNHRVRALDLITYRVSTLTGSSVGYQNGPFVSALFYQPCGVNYYSSPTSSVLYINQYLDNAVRKADFNTGRVTTAASLGAPLFGCLNRNGTLLFLATQVQTIVRVDLVSGAVVTIAGAYGAATFKDGVGTAARFSSPGGLTFNTDETAIYVGDRGNRRLRRIQLSDMNVTTVAGTGAGSSINGVPLESTFQSFGFLLWRCDRLTTVCGVMAVEYAAGSGGYRSLKEL